MSKDNRKSSNLIGKIPITLGKLQVRSGKIQAVLVRYKEFTCLFYGNKLLIPTKMNHKEIMKILNGQEPIAIVRYYEWTKISRSYAYPRYLLLRLNTSRRDIDEVTIPENIISLIIPYLKKFTELIRRNDGTVWERMDFREKVKELVPESKIARLIEH